MAKKLLFTTAHIHAIGKDTSEGELMSKIDYIEIYNALCIALTNYENEKDSKAFYEEVSETVKYMLEKLIKKGE